jgi:multidrug efflux pump subunit AcrB
VPLRQVAEVRLEPSPARIFRTDRIRSATVTAQVEEGFNTDKVTKAVLARLEKERFSKGIRVEPAGELESRQESFGGLGSAIIVAASASWRSWCWSSGPSGRPSSWPR